MSERIKELAVRANCTIDGMGYGEGNLEKFAELIVQDSLKFVEIGRDKQETKDLIMANFGVERPGPKCCVCGTTENLHKDGRYGYRCDSVDCMVF